MAERANKTPNSKEASRLLQLKGRIWESDLLDWRGFRIQKLQDWKRRLQIVDRLYAGDWESVFPDESIMRENPHVMNLVQGGMDDITKLVTETIPSVLCPVTKENERDSDEAHIREAIANTYWEVNNGDILTPLFAMDIIGAGCAYAAVYVDPGEDYPCVHRINPRFAYPDIFNGKLYDLMVLEDLNIRTAARMFPQLGLDSDPTQLNWMVELLHYYSPEECLQAVLTFPYGGGQATPNQAYIVNRWNPGGRLPVAFAQLDSFDGAFRGMFDQVAGSLQTKNRIVKQLLDYADQVIYSPFEEQGVLNPEAVPGPSTVYHLDPNVQGAGMRRIPPAAATAPVTLQLLEYLDKEQRAGVTYPESRGGEVSQSIASASFVSSTLGSLTSSVRNVQRLIGKLRERINELSFYYDETDKLNYTKPLLYAIGNRNTYTPKKDIQGQYRNRVVYGAGAGLDRMQADVRVMQHVGNGLVSKATAREQIDYLRDPKNENNRMELEQSDGVLMQKFLTEADLPTLIKVRTLQSGGMSLADAAAAMLAEIQARQEAQQEAMQQQQQGAQAGAAGPEDMSGAGAAGLQQQALQAGGQTPPPTFKPEPLENITVAEPTGGRLLQMRP